MENYRAIPEGYMRVGELAKKADITVRTLQYYDKEGLLSPSAESEGGFRLYTDKDMVRLIQIILLKQLGFSLREIKDKLTTMETTDDVVTALEEQLDQIDEQMKTLTESKKAIHSLIGEIEQVKNVDFEKYFAIFQNLKMKNNYYWMVKYMDDEWIDDFSKRITKEKAQEIINTTNKIQKKILDYVKKGVLPESEKGIAIAKKFLETVLELTDNNMEMIQKLNERVKNEMGNKSKNFMLTNEFTEKALNAYFASLQNEGENQ